MPFTDEDRRRGGAASKKHGLHALENRGPAALTTEIEQMGYRELRESLRQPAAREEIKLELMARLAVMMRVGFSEMKRLSDQGQDVFAAPVIGRLGGYLNLLARLLGSYPPQQRDSLAEEVQKIKALVRDAERVEETQVEDDQDSDIDAPGQAQGSGEGESD